MIKYGLRPGRRLMSTQASSILYPVEYTVDTTSNFKSTTSGTSHSISELISKTPSNQFLSTLKECHFKSICQNNEPIKAQIYLLLKDKQYDHLYKVLNTITLNLNKHHLNPSEITFFIRHIVDYQGRLVLELAKVKALRSTKSNESLILQKSQEVETWKNRIRKLYSNLLFDGKLFIYSNELRSQPFDAVSQSKFNNYILSIGDYENLINLEFHNNKFDLVNKWFERFETHFDKASYSLTMWKYKFKIAGGDPRLWADYTSEVYSKRNKVAKSKYHKGDLSQLLNEYLKFHKIDEVLPEVIYCLGERGLIDSIFKLLEGKYGITKTGEIINNKQPPTIEILNALITTLSYHKKYPDAIKLINTFQNECNVDLTGKKAKSFWETLIYWSDVTTMYHAQLVLQYFIKHYNPNVKPNSFKELLNDASFDYEQYLQFIGDFKQKRYNTMTQVWELYTSSNNEFSVKNYKIYSKYLRQLKDETLLFNHLKDLNKFHHQYSISPKSFNYVYLGMNNIIDSIENIYIYNLQTVVAVKLINGTANELELILEEWSLTKGMRDFLMGYYQKQMVLHQKNMLKKQNDELMKQREDDDDSLLNLF